jgi:hypothetical protein
MPPRIRERIGGRLFEEQPERAGTPVARLCLGRQTWLFLLIAAAFLCGVAMLLWAQGDIDRLILVKHNALRSQASVAGMFKSISGYGEPSCSS